jgi:hypothetical protein
VKTSPREGRKFTVVTVGAEVTQTPTIEYASSVPGSLLSATTALGAPQQAPYVK